MRNRVKAQGIEAPRGAYDGGSEGLARKCRGTHPRVFCKKRLQTIENKGRCSQKEGQEDTRGCKSMGGKELAGLRGRRRVICRANTIEVIILVYRLSSDFLSTCKFKIAKGLGQKLGLREKSEPYGTEGLGGRRVPWVLGDRHPPLARVGLANYVTVAYYGAGWGDDNQVFT